MLANKRRVVKLTTFAHGSILAHVEWNKKNGGEFEMKVRLKGAGTKDMKLSLAFALASRAFWILYCEADVEERIMEAVEDRRKS